MNNELVRPSDGRLPRFRQCQTFPGPGCPPVRRLLEGVTLVHHEGNHAGPDTGDDCHGNGHDHEWQHHGNGSIMRTGAVVPPTVLVTEIDTGGLIVQGRPGAPGRGDRW